MAEFKPIGAAIRDPQRPSGNLAGERRQVTVLFADMVGFTAASERLGEEGTYALIQPIYALMADAVRNQKGTVKSFTGDGIMAVFGVPIALEDAPLRACRAAVLIQQRLQQAADDVEATHGFRPQMRIGINSGLVVVASVQDGDGENATALGDTVNFASRLQTMAEPGAVYLSEATWRLVDGMVEADFAGDRQVKGKSELQSVYRLKAIREGATRFDGAINRGLTEFVGRGRELGWLRDHLRAVGAGARIIDIVGEPGMGKSRMLHEFRESLDEGQNAFLTGNCSPDGRQTAFLPFIEVVRGAFQLVSGENESDVARKLESGLERLDLGSPQNLGLLLNLLGLGIPEGALLGLDGILIGLRTRDLLIQMLQAHCRIAPVVLFLEDLHWLDSASEELLGRIITEQERISLLILHTRRPEYRPHWLSRNNVETLALEPLSAEATSRIVQVRLGLHELPTKLARLITEKAEGNALFAEELASFLLERGVIRQSPGGLEYDEDVVTAAMPASVQALLTARVDQLSPSDRQLLQIAATIGRRFDSSLLTAVAGLTAPFDDQLAAMKKLDLIYEGAASGELSFKHALVRDALYSSLLAGSRSALHLNIADEIERRSDNRLVEAAEILAHHYGQAQRSEKAFLYMAMAGRKSLGIYSLEVAETFCKSGLALLAANPECAGDEAVAQLLFDYSVVLQLLLKIDLIIETLEPWLFRVDRLGNHKLSALILHNYAYALLWTTRYEEAKAVQGRLSAMAANLGDDVSMVYAFTARVLVENVLAPRDAKTFASEIPTILAAARRADDRYLGIWLHWVLGWDAFHRSLILDCYSYAGELMALGRRVNDPRAFGFAQWLMGYAALTIEDYPAALKYAEEALDAVKTPFDVRGANSVKAIALILLNRLDEGCQLLQQCRHENAETGQHYQNVALDAFWGVALVLRGNLAAGIRQIKAIIAEQELKGYRAAADWHRMTLSDIYLEILEARQAPPLNVLIRNLATIIYVKLFGPREIERMMQIGLSNLQFSAEGAAHLRMNFIHGRRAELVGNKVHAKAYFEKAQRIASLYGNTPILQKIEARLATF